MRNIQQPCFDVVKRRISGTTGGNKGQRSPLTAGDRIFLTRYQLLRIEVNTTQQEFWISTDARVRAPRASMISKQSASTQGTGREVLLHDASSLAHATAWCARLMYV
jgi:hypothetical protein